MDGVGDEGRGAGVLESVVVVGQEIRRSSINAIAVDVLYVFTTAFFATLAVHGIRPAAIAALPLGVMLWFAWMSSRLFFLTNLIFIAVAVVASQMGIVPW